MRGDDIVRTKMVRTKMRPILLSFVLAAGVSLVGCERPPMETEQRNFRGLGVETVTNPRLQAETAARNQVPDPLPPIQGDSPPASEIFQNLEVLGHLSSGEFTRIMGAITQWVSPEQGCVYCHAGNDFAAEGPYQKNVARRMFQMTWAINREWKDHVGDTGVTCYTCHRGMNIPANYWHAEPGRGPDRGLVGNQAGQNAPGSQIGLASLPGDPFSPFLLGESDIRVQSSEPLPGGNRRSIKQTEWTYGFMMHLSTSLGVNCTYCHNSRAFSPWEASSPQRVTAWYGIRMARHLNETYMEPLQSEFPAHRKGPAGDVFKVNCATCHQGVAKPLGGMSMLDDYPVLAHAPGGSESAPALADSDAAQTEPTMETRAVAEVARSEER